jgi:hypothetical protein
MLVKKCTSLIIIIFLPLILNPQEIFTPFTPQPESDEFKQYVNMIDSNNITRVQASKHIDSAISIADMSLDDVKKLVSLAFFSRLYNPIKYKEKQKNYSEKVIKSKEKIVKNYSSAIDLFIKKNQYNRFQFNNKHILFDLYFAPYVFAGTITNIDTIHQYVYASDIKIIKYEMIITDNINKYLKADVINKKIIFLFSTGHWGKFSRPSHSPISHVTPKEILYKPIPEKKFIVGRQYIVFLSWRPSDFTGLKNVYNNLPYLRLTAYKNMNFPVEDSYITDKHGYFGKGERVKLEEVNSIINNIIYELASWRE